ncbi:dihydrolipoyl dehydrogenase [Alkalihalobacterium alkalinitrilicum]|uniref:dihydrolipoyl dehydrogenase n=1 Tax=Alkalihalobacterium alkalinitrilicum TaxID=427920 RepID=UPI0009958BEB|nr:dihydrolipoyl dehydrogenase [Alkalihalobacterium alkalinitrilicum]
MDNNYDLTILGGGTGGYVAAIRASQFGLKVAIIEKGKLGGTCLHRGCIPSKSLLRSAEVYSHAKTMDSFGVSASDVTLDFSKVQERKEMIVNQLYQGVQYLMKKGQITVYNGTGKIVSPNAGASKSVILEVQKQNGEIVELISKNLIIATGSSPRDLPGLVTDEEFIINSDHALQLEQLPSSIAIIGGGVIGIEWASMLADFGVEVSVIETMDRILPQEDQEISKEVQRILKKKGIKVLTSAKVQDISKQDGEVEVSLDVKGKSKSLSSEKVLLSVGRKANIENIGLETTRIDVQKGVIQTNEFCQTSKPNVYAIGDVIGGLQLAHVASHEGLLAVEHITNNNPVPIDYSSIPKCVYSQPQVASVGLTEEEAVINGYSIKTGKFPFKAIGKALVYGEADGFAKVVIDNETNKLLGVHMVGPSVTDLISEAGLAKFLNATHLDLAHSIHPHPSLSEIFGEVALISDNIPIHM